MRATWFACLILGFWVAGCSGGGITPPANQEPLPPTGGGGNPNTPLPPGPPAPPPPPPSAPVVFTDDAVDLGTAGAFPSDLERATDETLYTVNDATIPARVVGVRNGQVVMNVPITANDLMDFNGQSPALTPISFGPGLFGAFTGDFELAFDRWLFVLVGGGNSYSTSNGAEMRLGNVVLIDTQTGTIAQTINVAWPKDFNGDFSNGGPYAAIPQSLPSMCSFVPARNGTETGTLYVAMSNGAGSSAGLQTFFNGTVQSWRVDFTASAPVAPDLTGRAPKDATRTYVSNFYNPVGLTRFTNSRNFSFLILTDAGASRFDENSVAHAETDARLEFLDLDTETFRDTWTANLGRILPSIQKLAISNDDEGDAFAVATSQTFNAAYLLDLSGLEENPVDPARLGLLQTVALSTGGDVTAGSGFLPGVALSASGKTALVTSFSTSRLVVLELPDDVATGTTLINPAPFLPAALGPARGSLGAIVMTPGAAADVHFIVNGTFDANFAPDRHGFLGTLSVGGALK